MALTKDQIDALLAKDAQKRTRARKPSIDFSDPTSRTYINWFGLAHKLYDEETQEFSRCGNPNCQDTRTDGNMIVEILGRKMCRLCFIDQWGCTNPGQLSTDAG